MVVRKGSGTPGHAPHIGPQELYLEEATGDLYGNLGAGPVPISFSGQARAGGQTTDATPASLVFDATGVAALVLADDSLVGFRALVIGRNEDADENAVYFLQGAVKRGAGVGTAALVGVVSKTVQHEDVAGWDCDCLAETALGGLKIEVTGEAATTIEWRAVVTWIDVTA